ncbi:MAG: SMI1/KNR4 family protein [Polyangiaceae bacterium]
MSAISTTVDRLRRAGAQLADMGDPPRFGPGCCNGELDELGAWYRGLPADYREFLSLTRSVHAADVFNGYFFYSPLQVARRDDSLPRVLQLAVSGPIEEVPVVAVAGDGGGNQFVLGMAGQRRGWVWKWCHEYPVRFDGVANMGLTQVASTFAAFVERVAEDWEHFARDDQTWAYLSG